MERLIVEIELKLINNPTLGLIWATFAFFVGFAAVSLYGPAAKSFKELLHLSGIELGLLVSVPYLTGSLLRLPFGAWVDKVGGRKPMLTLLFLSILGMGGLTLLLFSYYPDRMSKEFYPIILLLGVLSGCSIATYSVGIAQVSYCYPKSKQGTALGIYAGIGNTAAGIFALILPIAISAWGLPRAYLAWFVFLLAGTLLYAIFAVDACYFQLTSKGVPRERAVDIAKQMGQELIPKGGFFAALAHSAKNFKTWILVFLYAICFGAGFLGLTAWLPAYWSIYHGVSIVLAGTLTALGYSILASLVRVLGGYMSDRVGGERVALSGFVFMLAGSMVVFLTVNFYVGLIGTILLGIGVGLANAAVFKLVSKYVPEAVGGAAGWVGGLGSLGGFVAPPALGAFVQFMGGSGYAKGFVIYIILSLIAVFVTALLKRFGGE